MVEVQVGGKERCPSDIKNFVEKIIESMQPLALRAREGKKRGPDIVHLMVLEGLKVWAVLSNNTRMDMKCVLAVSTLKGTLALLRYGCGFDRWVYINPLWGALGWGR